MIKMYQKDRQYIINRCGIYLYRKLIFILCKYLHSSHNKQECGYMNTMNVSIWH